MVGDLAAAIRAVDAHPLGGQEVVAHMDVGGGGVATQGEDGIVLQHDQLVRVSRVAHMVGQGLLQAQARRIEHPSEAAELGGAGDREAEFRHVQSLTGAALRCLCRAPRP